MRSTIDSLIAFYSSVAFGGGIAFERGITFDSEILVYCLISFNFRVAINGLVTVDVSVTGNIESTVNVCIFQVAGAVYRKVFTNREVVVGSYIANEVRGTGNSLIAVNVGIAFNRLAAIYCGVAVDVGITGNIQRTVNVCIF